MSFYTSLNGIKNAQTDLNVVSNNTKASNERNQFCCHSTTLESR